MKSVEHLAGGEYSFIRGGGEMGELVRSYPWTASPLGPPENWPSSLRTTLGILLHSAFPMFLFWGDDFICFYNDAYRPSLGREGKHPAIGKKGKEVWPEIWDFIGPLIDKVMETEEPVWFEDQYLPIFRNGAIEDVYWTFSYSPAYKDDGTAGGVFVTCTETTAKVQTIDKLRESEKRFQNLVGEAAVGIVVVVGEELIVEIVNNAYAKLVNLTAADLQGKPLFSVIPEDEPHFETIIKRVMTTGGAIELSDYPYTTLNGDKKGEGYLNLVYQPYKREDGRINGVMVLCQEVTEQVLARKKIEEAEQRIRSLVESAPFPIGVYVGKEMRIALANQAIIDVWGKGVNVIGKLYTELLPELENSEIFEQLEAVYSLGLPYHAQNQRVDILVNGIINPYYFNYSFTPLFDAAGAVYGVMNTAAEVTDLNLAKQQVEESGRNLRNIILKAPVAMCILKGPEHIVEIANDQMTRLWGKTTVQVLGKPILEGLPEIKGQGFEELLDGVLATGETFTGQGTPVLLQRGEKIETVYVNFIYEAYREPDKEITGILVVAVDVTDQVVAIQQMERSEQELLDTKSRLEIELEAGKQLQKQKDDFIGIASHELKTPLTALKSSMQLLGRWLKDDTLSPKVQHLIALSNSSISKLNNLLEELLNDTRISEGQLLLNKSTFNMANAISECADHLRVMGSHEIVIEGDTELGVHADRQRLDQVVINLLNNAIKYAPRARMIVVKVENYAQGQAKISVTDKGPGILPEKIPHLFKRYYRVDTSGIQYSGLGLGLFIAAEIIRRHGGEIGVTSEIGEGSTFWFTVPVVG